MTPYSQKIINLIDELDKNELPHLYEKIRRDYAVGEGDAKEVKYGCHVDGELSPGCVLDDGSEDCCVHAKEGMKKEDYEYWKLVEEEKKK